MNNRLRDRDIIRDYSDRIYVVLGHIQPHDHAICFLKYIPSTEGKWNKDGQSFRRVFWGSVQSVDSGFNLAASNLIKYDEHFGTDLLEVPLTHIKKHYLPEERLSTIVDSENNDVLEESVEETAKAISGILGIDMQSLGVAGSILWGAHDPSYSDINMNVYGFESSKILQQNMDRLESEHPEIRIRKEDEWDNAISRVTKRIPALSKLDLEVLFSRRRALYYQERCIGISPILYPEESPIQHSTERYRTISNDPIKIEMQIENTEYGLFHPAIYLGQSEGLKLANGDSVSRIMAYDGAFGGVLQENDIVEVSGTLQEVNTTVKSNITGNQSKIYQLMVGTLGGAGKEFIRLMN